LGARFLFKKQLIVLFLIVAARCAAYAIPEEIGETGGKEVSLSLPSRMGAWAGKDVKVDPVVYEVLQPDAVLQKRYKMADSRGNVEVLVVYSRDPKGLHSPVTCMRAQGWTITDQERREVRSGGEVLTVDVLTGEQRDRRTQLAYCFTDAGEAVSGRVATFAKMMAARFMRRRIGAVEMQFAFDRNSLLPNGDFTPQFKALMLQTAQTVRTQLAAQNQA
jgi:EpsI family protein